MVHIDKNDAGADQYNGKQACEGKSLAAFTQEKRGQQYAHQGIHKPEDGYPEYYESAFFENNNFPGCYFKLGSIAKIPIKSVSNFYVVSSGNDALTTLNNSMSSFLFVTFGVLSENELEKIRIKKANTHKETCTTLSINDCFYRKEGICTLKSCINYQYECDRPSSCAKQKR